MATDDRGRWSHADGSAQRLLDEIGAADLDYYSAREENAVAAALRAWPLLGAVARALASFRAPPEPHRDRSRASTSPSAQGGLENETQLRVVTPPEEKAP
jgi:hypothetical protein